MRKNSHAINNKCPRVSTVRSRCTREFAVTARRRHTFAKPTWHGPLPAGSDIAGRARLMVRCWAAYQQRRPESPEARPRQGATEGARSCLSLRAWCSQTPKIMIPLMGFTRCRQWTLQNTVSQVRAGVADTMTADRVAPVEPRFTLWTRGHCQGAEIPGRS